MHILILICVCGILKINFKLYRASQFHSRILMTILSCFFSSSMRPRKNTLIEDGFIIKIK